MAALIFFIIINIGSTFRWIFIAFVQALPNISHLITLLWGKSTYEETSTIAPIYPFFEDS